MEYFLENIARSLNNEFGNTLNRHCLVFPNRRAGLYFLKYLAARIDKPVWTPPIITINDLFKSYSSLQVAGSELLLFELYKIYRSIKKSPESFDDFYFWGDMLLNDFDDVDKYLVDPSVLFRNIKDIKDIDQEFGGLSDAQIEIIRRFWVNFDPEKPTNEKTGFISLWSILYKLYSDFKRTLKDKNLAFEGMIFRELAESPDEVLTGGTGWDMVHFIGFNALNECEKVIMSRFKKAGKARFYWDYDYSYLKEDTNNSAGFFLKQNLKLFGNNMPEDWSYETILSVSSQKVKRRVIEVSSDVAQVKLIAGLLSDIPDLSAGNAHHTAIVMADENLLMPVLTSLPEDIGDINITMGYPLKQTIVYTLVKQLMELQRTAIIINDSIQFNHREVINILRHSMISGLLIESEKTIADEIVKNNIVWVSAETFEASGRLSGIFIKPSTPSLLSDYFREILLLIAQQVVEVKEGQFADSVQRGIMNEFIYRIVTSVNRLESFVNSPEISFTTDTYIRILDKMLRMQSVPFSGEPLSGVQIMGILETRALDFKNLIILSVNEGILPAVSAGSSFIPYTLREAFGLPSINHQESVYAYHFYRLLQRADNVTFTYNSNSDGLRSGEISRFILQMKYNEVLKPDFTDISFEIKTNNVVSEILERTEEHNNQLHRIYLVEKNARTLSPSAINTWLNCRMKFFYRYVNGLIEPEKVTPDIDPLMLGNILHKIMRTIYNDYTGKALSSEEINKILNDSVLLQSVINEVIKGEYNDNSDRFVNGNELIVRDVLLVYIKKILNADRNIAPLSLLNIEDNFSFIAETISDGKQITVKVGGTVDRIDVVSGVTRIVDYKTGTVADSISSINDLFTEDRKKDIDCWLQTLIYCESYIASGRSVKVCPSIYKIKKMNLGLLSDRLRLKTGSKTDLVVDDYNLVRDEFLDGLSHLLAGLFSIDQPFVMTSDIRGKCSYCPYQKLCMR